MHPPIGSPFPDLCKTIENVHLRGAADYDCLREELIWNARMQRKRSPEAIARPKCADEVATIVRIAGACGMRIALRGSGHNYQGAALRDSGIMIDLSGLNDVEVDVAARRARIGPGITGGQLIEKLSQRGLGFPIGHCADVAASGYILSGGFGWNYGEWGPACANVAAIDMVLANGERVTADADTHAELFWAARGAGCGFFAAVTGYELILHPLPAVIFSTNTVFDAAAAPQLAEWLNQASLAAHRAVEIICLVGPDHSTGKPSVTIRAIGYASSIADARAKLGPLLAPPAGAALLAPAEVGTVAFTDLTKLSSMPSGKRVAADQIWSDAPLGDLLGAIAHLASGPQATSAISLTGLGGGARTPFMANGDFALSIGGTRSAGIYALWDGADQDQLHLEWVAAAGAALAPFKNGRYVAEADLFNQPPRIEECFSADAWKRLTELKDHYDPKGRFFAV